MILVLNIALTYHINTNTLQKDTEAHMMTIAEEIAIAMEQSQESADHVEQKLEEYLRLSSIRVSNELDADITNITNEQLTKLSKDMGLSRISLLSRTSDDVIVTKSSDSTEVGQSSVGLGYGKRSLFQLFDHLEEASSEQINFDHFLAGPFEYSTSYPYNMHKSGCYYDGKRNYIINTYMYNTPTNNSEQMVSLEDTIADILKNNKQVLEITGINPLTFDSSRLSTNSSSQLFKLSNRPIRFGTYDYSNIDHDREAIIEVMTSGKRVLLEETIQGTQVLKSFIPTIRHDDSAYVISIVMDKVSILFDAKERAANQIYISLVLFIISLIGSYLLARCMVRPIQLILQKLNDVENGNFNTYLAVHSKDELGLLSTRISALAYNMNYNTNQLKKTIEEKSSVKEHLESVINQTADAIYVVDIYRNIIEVNKAFEELYGWRNDEVIGRKLNIIPNHLEFEELERIQQILNGKHPQPMETVHVRKDGSLVEVSINTSTVRDKEGHIVSLISVSRDMTERNRMEELLRRSEKLTTVGELAAGVAHEIRNPLTTLRGFMQLQKENKKLNERHIDIMLSEIDRINLIVSEFLILAKPQAVVYQEKDIRLIIEDVVSLLDSQAHLCDTEFKYELPDAEVRVHCEENQLKQVFINLFKNAMEAMPLGGIITISFSISDSNYVQISIQDQGVGIPEEMLSKLGEPFFSNKESGTGLGLMISQRIIQGHKGILEVESKVNIGTLIKIILPISTQNNDSNN